MAQIRRQTRNLSPPPQRLPVLPSATRLPASPPRPRLPAQHIQRPFINEQPHQNGFPIRMGYPPMAQTNHLQRNAEIKYDPLTGLIIDNNNERFPLHVNSTFNQQSPSINGQQQPRQQPNPTEVMDESLIVPSFNDDERPGGPSATRHLPVYAQFPFDISRLPQPMETNVEDHIHKLRLRLIDSELNHQRRSTNEYLKRTQEHLFLSSPTPTEFYAPIARPPTVLIHQDVTPARISSETSSSRWSITSPSVVKIVSRLSQGRIGYDSDVQNAASLEQELDVRRLQGSLPNDHRTTPQMVVPSYMYDRPRQMQLLAPEDRQFTSSNMDDLIDSMARRHLAYRRLDANIDRQRRNNNGHHSPYQDAASLGRRLSLRNQRRNEDFYLGNTIPSSHIDRDFIRTHPNHLTQALRSRIDYYTRIQPDNDAMGMDSIFHTNSYSKLPPISPGHDSHRLQNPSGSILYHAKHDPHVRPQAFPLRLPDHSEHLIELPSDIFLTSKPDDKHHYRGARKIPQRPISREKSDVSVDLQTDRSDGENDSSIVNHRYLKQQHRETNSKNDHQGFFTESKQDYRRRHPFRAAAIATYFFVILKRGAIKSRATRPRQSASATIFKIRLQEMMVALHRVYLEPDGPIYNTLVQTITNSIPLQDALNRSATQYNEAIQVIGDTLKNVTKRIVDFMPRDGILGTAKTSAVAALIQDGNRFPENYFWHCERELLEFDNGKIIHITKQRAILLLVGIFLFRALVTTLLCKPIKYRLVLGQLSQTQSASLKVLASVMLHVGRRVAAPSPQVLAVPHEWQLSLYTDAAIQPILQHPEIKSIINTCEISFRIWCEEYIRRIDASFDQELRQ